MTSPIRCGVWFFLIHFIVTVAWSGVASFKFDRAAGRSAQQVRGVVDLPVDGLITRIIRWKEDDIAERLAPHLGPLGAVFIVNSLLHGLIGGLIYFGLGWGLCKAILRRRTRGEAPT